MAIIPEVSLFSWQDVQSLGDLERLCCVVDALPDEALMRALETHRGRGHNDYLICPLWNSILAEIVFQHSSIDSLRRELFRNGPFREFCGFGNRVPSAWAYTRFLQRLMEHLPQVERLFDELAEPLRALLPDFGEQLAVESKVLSSFATHKNAHETPGGRRDLDADHGGKAY